MMFMSPAPVARSRFDDLPLAAKSILGFWLVYLVTVVARAFLGNDPLTVVENKSGGGGTIAMTDFVRQKPDGHTIMLSNPGPNAIAYSIFRNLPYTPDHLQPVSNIIRTSNIVSAHP